MTDSGLVSELRAIVGAAAVLTGADTATYDRGARYGNGRALCVVRPGSTREVAGIVALCAAQGVQALAQGANTGLVGAGTPDASGRQVVISTERLRSRCEIDVVNRSVEADAGLTLQALNDALERHGLWFPVDLAADPTLGGMVACNTGGTRLIRYGDVRHNLLEVEAVLFEPAGKVVRFGKPLRKNNMGFDLKQLFAGTGCTAGVITAVTLRVVPRPRQRSSALLVPASDESVGALLVRAGHELGDFLSAFEGMSAAAVGAALDHVPSLRNPFGATLMPEFPLLLEVASGAGADELDLDGLLTRFLERALEAGLIVDAVTGRGEDFWRLRHALSDGARAMGKVIGFDVSVRSGDVMPFRRAALAVVERGFPDLRVLDFGHVGDGGLHFNVVWPHAAARPVDEEEVGRLRDAVYELVCSRFAGSISAEHGIGPHNLSYYRQYSDPESLRLAGRLQQVLDPFSRSGSVWLGTGQEAA